MLTFPSRLKFKMSKNVRRQRGVIHIYNFIFITTFCVHVTVSKNSLQTFNGIKPVFAADRLLSFTCLNLFARLGG